VHTVATNSRSFEALLLEARACFFAGRRLVGAIERFASVH
jgi:hypothetical protein